MAVKARITHYDGFISLELHPGVQKAAISSAPDDRSWPFDFDYDDNKFAEGEREFLGIEVLDISRITDYWLTELDKIDLPRVNVPEADLYDAKISDVLRWARETYPSRYSSATA